MSMYEQDLPKNDANFVAISPLSFIQRTAAAYPDKTAIIHGDIRQSWAQTYSRCRQLASALQQQGIGLGDTVAVMLPNTPPMVEAHFGIPMAGAVLNTLNTRLDPQTLAFMLNHAEAKVIIVDPEFTQVIQQALDLRQSNHPILVIDTEDAYYTGSTQCIGQMTYDAFVATGDAAFDWQLPSDEWQAISLNYTSGTTGNPKGVVYHHRGAALNAISNILEWDMPKHPVYLWTLPMFHCNGWCFPWTLAARAGVNVCLRRVDAKVILDMIREYNITHYCGAPIVHTMLVTAPDEYKVNINHRVKAMVAGAAPPAAMIESMEALGFDLTHVYGLTEVYGPAAVCVQHDEWDEMSISERAMLNARQGINYHLQEDVTVMNPETMQRVPKDGQTMGEIMFRGNITMKGYLKNPKATQEAFKDGWFHTGDLGVINPDGYIKLKDRSKDIIISGGENISSLEVEDILYHHPAVLAAAVVAKPDQKWGETPCAFIELKTNTAATEAEIIAHCKQHLAGFKVPRHVIFGEMPKTSTGKIQKLELRKVAQAI